MVQAYKLSPIFTGTGSSPRTHNGSSLYDSYELKAVLKQLNRAIRQGSKEQPLSPTTSYVLNSPYNRRRLAYIHEENAKAERRITGSQIRQEDNIERNTPAEKVTKGLGQLWKKVKHKFVCPNR